MTMPRTLRARTVAIDDPGDLLDLLPDPSARVWLHEGEGLVATGTAASVAVPTGWQRTGQAREALATVLDAVATDDPIAMPGTGPVAFASLTFDPERAGSRLVVPEVVVGRRDGRAWLTVVAEDGDPRLADPARVVEAHAPPVPHDRVRYAGSGLAELRWLDAVAAATKSIADGEVDKVVLARDRIVWARAPFDPRLLVRRLAARFPSCYTFAVDGLVGATPELLARRWGRAVTSRVLAGSAPRAADAETDAAHGAALRGSAKDVAEHAFAVDSVRAALAPVPADLTADAEPWLLRLANVQHLATDVHGTLADDAEDVLSLGGRLHPTAAVCGTPTLEALEVIRRLEHLDRGRYAGPVGWVDARGDGELGIALRCAEVDGARARLFAGAGIVAASLPEDELEETRLKLRAMASAVEG